ncbi:MOSC domain-containing protein [Thermoleophilia bacterium SCSIO 60948]|nr:MOSC domain-containing protein [Thermoleophilia bacterium SCSIO 60948]
MRVAALRRFPVKSMRGEDLDRVDLRQDGFAGDRSVTLRTPTGKLVTARVRERMLGVQTSLTTDGDVLVDGHAWDSADAAAIAEDLAGEGANFEAADGGHLWDDTPLLLTTDGAVAAVRDGLDPLRFRANIHVEGVDGLGERDWVGRDLRIGDEAVVRIAWTCERCKITTIDPEPDSLEIDPDVLRRINRDFGGDLGLCATVVSPGPLAVGDRVEVL